MTRFSEHFISSDTFNIHYIDTITQADPSLVPLLICPGLSETAAEYLDLMEYLLPRRTVVLSFRGRGESGTPETGYNLEQHIGDIKRVIEHAELHKFHLFGYSRGVSYALGYAVTNADRLISLTLQDYPAMHKHMPSGWAEDYIHNYLIPYNRTTNIRPEAVRGIERESTTIELDITKINCPLLVMRGKLEGSLLPDEELEKYNIYRDITLKEFHNSGHDIRTPEKALFNTVLRDFITDSEQH